VRAGGLIGQLARPLYPKKLNALYQELVGTGMHDRLGYLSPADVAVLLGVGSSAILDMTMDGKQWTAALKSTSSRSSITAAT